MKNSIKLLFALVFISNLGFAQKKVFVLINKKNQDSIFIKENHRIKLFTNDNKKIVGRLKIIDENTIIVKADTISITNIRQIKKASTFSGIVGTTFKITGILIMAGGIIGLSDKGSGGYISPQAIGTAALIIGTPMIVIPISDNEHRIKKWEYKILINYTPNL